MTPFFPTPRLQEGEQRFVDWLSLLLKVGSPPGFEEVFGASIAKELTTLGYDYEFDPSGNLLVSLPAEGEDFDNTHVMVAAHMDEIAVVVKAIFPDGSVELVRSGGMLPYKVGERPLLLLGDHATVPGILSMGSGHAANGGMPPQQMSEWSACRLMTGLSPKALTKAGVRPGTPAVLRTEDRGPVVFGSQEQPLIGAWTLDDRAGCAILLEWLRQHRDSRVPLRHRVTIAFTVHEEGGCLGAIALATRARPDFFIAIDGAPWKPGDGYNVNDQPVAWSKDQLANYHQPLLAHIREAALKAGSTVQYAVIENGYSDASSVYKSGGAPRIGLLGHARISSHGFEVARAAVFPAVVATLRELLSRDLEKRVS